MQEQEQYAGAGDRILPAPVSCSCSCMLRHNSKEVLKVTFIAGFALRSDQLSLPQIGELS